MTALNDYKKLLASNLFSLLKGHGFKKSGNNFYKENNDLVYYISLQSSQSSTAEMLKCTLNIEVMSRTLYKMEDVSIPEHLQRHFTKRIGGYMPGNDDKWWEISSITDAQQASVEIGNVLTNDILPELFSLTDTSDLKTLCAKGSGPGLTDRKRKEYLALLGG